MKTNLRRISGAMILAMILSSGINAQPRDGRGQGQGPERRPCMAENGRAFACLDLSEAQEEELSQLRSSHYKTMKPLRNQQAELRLKKRNLMSEDDVDLKAVNKLIDEQSALSAKMQKLNAAHRVEARSVLTEEQRMKLEQQQMRSQGRRAHGRAYGQGRSGRHFRM